MKFTKQKGCIKSRPAVAALALGLCACMGFGGCGSLRLTPDGSEAQSTPSDSMPAQAVPAAEQVLNVYYDAPSAAAATLLNTYASEQGVTVNQVEDTASAGLWVLAGTTGDANACRDLGQDALLAATANRAELGGSFTAMPIGRTLYCYWADSTVLSALLGESFSLTDLQDASWTEWNDFIETLGGWLDDPTEEDVTLSGNHYTLSAEKAGAAQNLTSVFSLPQGCFSGAAYSAVMVAADNQRTDEALYGPLNGLLNGFKLEVDRCGGTRNETAAAVQNVADGNSLFYRGLLTDLTGNLSADACQNLVPVPQKCYFTADDLTTADYNVEGLMNYPVLTDVGAFAVPSDADDGNAKQGMSFLLWLYSSDSAESVLTDTLNLITPWKTASNSTTLGAMQVEIVNSGVVPGAELSTAENTALEAALSDQLGLTNLAEDIDRDTFIASTETALGVQQPAEGDEADSASGQA